MQPVTSSVVKGINGRGVIRAGRIYVNKFFVPFRPNNIKLLVPNNIKITKYFNYEPRFSDVS